MSFQDDSKSPAAFTGDSDVFDLPDTFLQSPTTTERVVDTQSGFLVVVKRQTERISISVKRRLGTPPNSSVLLTPDESLKLSRILATSLTAEEFQRERVPRSELRRHFGSSQFDSAPFNSAEYRDSQVDNHSSQYSDSKYGDSQCGNTLYRDGEYNYPYGESNEQIPPSKDGGRFASLEQEALAGVAAARARKTGKRAWFRAINPRLVGVSCTVALVLSAVGISAGLVLNNTFGPTAPDSVNIPNPLTPEKIDGFARVYVSDLLDFNPDSYKISQIQAMSHMSQQLLERYWKETKFPLTNAQLEALPQKCTVMITEIQQKPIDMESADVDIYAHMVQPNSRVMAPLHLKLKLGTTADGTIRVIEQQDITATAPEPPGTPAEAPTPAASNPTIGTPCNSAGKPATAASAARTQATPTPPAKAAVARAASPSPSTSTITPTHPAFKAQTPARPANSAVSSLAATAANTAPASSTNIAPTGTTATIHPTYRVYGSAAKPITVPLSSAARRLKALDAKVAPMAITPPAKTKPTPSPAPATSSTTPPVVNAGADYGTTSGDADNQEQ